MIYVPIGITALAIAFSIYLFTERNVDGEDIGTFWGYMISIIVTIGIWALFGIYKFIEWII